MEEKDSFAEVKGYKLDFVNNVLVMNYTFTTEAQKFGTPEYKLLKAIQEDFPHLKPVTVSGRKQKTPKQNKRLTYANMEKYLSVFDNSKELLAQFVKVKAASAASKSPYKYVCDWFKDQCPNYDTAKGMNYGTLTLLPVPKIAEKEPA